MDGRGRSSSTSLVATWARFGERFWREMAHRLAGDTGAAARALAVVETAARLFRHHSGRESEDRGTGEAVAAHPLPRWLTDPSPEPVPGWATVPAQALSDVADAAAALVAAGDCTDRARALRVLGWLDDGDHQDVVRAHLAHDDGATRVAAIHALAPGDERSAQALIGLVAGASGRTRVSAVQALARQGTPDAVPAMVALAGEDDRELKELAVTALAGLAGEHAEARAALERLSASSDPWVSRLAQGELAAASRPNIARRTSPSAVRSHAERQQTRGSMHHIAMDAAMRALPEMRAYDDTELTERIATVCNDWCATRREVVELRLMRRESNRYEFTPLGEAIWRVEHYIMEHYLRG
jgi:hypothetical protein